MSLRSGNVLVLDEAIQTEKHSPYLAGNTAVSRVHNFCKHESKHCLNG